MNPLFLGLLASALGGATGVWLTRRRRSGRDGSALLRAEVGAALARPGPLHDMLQPCAEAMVRHLGGAFARIWVLAPDEQVLELRASAGRYTHLDGEHARIAVGQLKIGQIARSGMPLLINDVPNDPRVRREWARHEGLVAFAGYPLLAEGRVVGVMAMFARGRLEDDVLEAMASVADAMAQGIARQYAEERLRRSEELFRLLLDSTGEAIYGMDLKGRCTFANRTCVRLLGYPDASALIGRRMHELMHHSHEDGTPYPRKECPIYEATAKEGIHLDDEWLWRADGRGFPAEIWSYPLWREGERLGAVVTFVDISERRAAEAERARLLHETQEAVRARDDFLAIASHELRTPLTPLRLGLQSAQRMLQDGQPPPVGELRSRLAVTNRQVVRLTRLVESMLDLSRLTRGTLQLETAPCDLAELVNDVLERSREVLAQAECSLDAQVEGPLPVLGDRLRLEQVLENLLSNAMKYGACSPVHIHCRAEQGRALLSVEDEGIGISPEDQQRIFGRFERAASVRHYGGFGLGLYILREIVEAHGGNVSVESQPGQGARFTVTLPLLETPA
ncbi:GAF domain-containing protein [Archangium violaceum]|uniref:sensor histidine kinase n=1 Tax=Archangium violaceum TaxID=83451 RepID=UPI00193B4B81|nr:ATP-binding protein [Archangium violaceum]QRK09521.1 GAF domain-containing protein [Archangium violaceum]